MRRVSEKYERGIVTIYFTPRGKVCLRVNNVKHALGAVENMRKAGNVVFSAYFNIYTREGNSLVHSEKVV